MNSEIIALTITAATIGFGHTLMGPDHYLPFIAVSKARGWSALKTFIITLICGLGHVGSSVVLGFLGIGLGIVVGKLEGFEAFRGNLAGWLLTGFGLAYMIWGIKKAIRNKTHTHFHVHEDDSKQEHTHDHDGSDAHIHVKKSYKQLTPWILFTIFVFGPCEPLIPILMYPAAQNSIAGVVLVTLTFAGATILTMLAVVMAGTFGLGAIHTNKLARFSHALAGFTIFLCGMAIQMGL